MQADLIMLLGTAVTISLLHTLAGPDHYLPFIALSKAKGWSLSRTLFWTIVCGCGHVWSSVILGLGGAALGWSLSKVTWLEQVRGGVAAWAFLLFGIVYAIIGLVRAGKNRRHKHFDMYEDGSLYVYEHKDGEVVAPNERHTVTPWVMFVIFLLGPCEPMIPLLYLPAAKNSTAAMVLLITVYTVFTLAIMLLLVVLGYYGFSFLKTEKLEKHMHAIGGATITICGLGMIFFNW
jgi:hypothetical protein